MSNPNMESKIKELMELKRIGLISFFSIRGSLQLSDGFLAMISILTAC